MRIETPRDLENVASLDESLWVATSAPAGAFRCDPKFTSLLDTDGSGRICSDEVKRAILWTLGMLTDRTRLGEEIDSLPLTVINSALPEGDALVKSARYVLRVRGKRDAESIALADVRAFLEKLLQQPLNGDGVIVPEAANDPATADFIRDVQACTGGSPDRSGRQGVAMTDLDRFRDAVVDYLEWRERGRIREDAESNDVMPLGRETPVLYELYRQHADIADHFFLLCRAIGFEPRTAALAGCSEEDLRNLDLTRSDGLAACLGAAPIARPNAAGKLPLDGQGVNPVYRDWLRNLRERVLVPVLDDVPDVLAEEDWLRVKDRFQPYADYLGTRKGACVERLEPAKLERYRLGREDEAARAIVEADKKVARVLEGIVEVERLLLYHRYLMPFVNNFVSFSSLYSVRERAMFETGSAVIDGRWFELALKVDDVAAHQAAAKAGNIFSLYLEVTSEKNGNKFNVVVPATSGSRGNLCVGKRGVFFDIEGREYDARVTHIVENPISLREALVAPFVRLWNSIIGKIEALSESAEKDLRKSTDAVMQQPAQASPAGAAPGGLPGGPAALLVGLSVSAAAIGSAGAFITKTLSDMSRMQAFMGLAGAALVVGIPVTLVAVIKLRSQDLSSLLEGCGWAVNARMRFNRAQRRQFTRRSPYPANATGTPARRRRRILLTVLIIEVVMIALYLALV